jgi:uncharacterized protein YjiS (DUF1127 family)
MVEMANARRPLSSFEFERQARLERSLVINALMRSAARKFAGWLRVVVRRSARRARSWAAGHLRRRAIRALQQLDDRALADIGVSRSDIESAVRDGRPARVARKLLQRRHGRSRVSARRRVA